MRVIKLENAGGLLARGSLEAHTATHQPSNPPAELQQSGNCSLMLAMFPRLALCWLSAVGQTEKAGHFLTLDKVGYRVALRVD